MALLISRASCGPTLKTGSRSSLGISPESRNALPLPRWHFAGGSFVYSCVLRSCGVSAQLCASNSRVRIWPFHGWIWRKGQNNNRPVFIQTTESMLNHLRSGWNSVHRSGCHRYPENTCLFTGKGHWSVMGNRTTEGKRFHVPCGFRRKENKRSDILQFGQNNLQKI